MLIAHRTRDTQAVAAEMDGKVLEMDEVSITVEYNDGKQSAIKKYPLGRTYGRHEGSTFPNDMVSNVKLGQRFKAGDILAYNSKHFEPDLITPTQVNWKAGPIVTAYFLESTDTLDDSSAIDAEASQLLTAEIAKEKYIFVNFKDEVHNLIKVGSVVNPETILCSIEDPLTADQSVFSEESKNSLLEITDRSPKAGVSGIIDKFEVFYNGQLEDMSDSIRDIAKYGDRLRKKEASVSPTTLATTGQVDSSLRLDGKPVEIDTLVVRIYISHDSEAIGGDKAVVANQMKTTFRRRMIGTNKTEDGKRINLIFGKKSIDERIVYSVYQIGTAMTYGRLMADGARQLVEQG